ncbi:sensor histidine kinase [Microlunatus elymi]|uniref:sensor histidine kinase n=1 Tax=Microlunatus elymi TaxID=2596828 RepID=UPI00143CDCF6|nr:histidine kinase [Microlunatus elymi]
MNRTRDLSRGGRLLFGVLLGAISWPIDLVALIATAVARLAGRGRRPAMIMVGWHRRRLTRWLRWADRGEVTDRRAPAYLGVRASIGILAMAVLGLLAYGIWSVAAVLLSWLFGVRVTVLDSVGDGRIGTATVLGLILPGALLLFLNLMGVSGVAALDRMAADRWLRPSRNDVLQQEVDELRLSRSDLVAAIDAERARIERDLHDGVQQRAVALGLLINRARRRLGTGQPASDLLDRAGIEAAGMLDDLREVAWRVRPSTLEAIGLAATLAQLADRSTPPVKINWPDPVRLPAAHETCIYYVVSECLTNAGRHSAATRVDVEISADDQRVTVIITDDGVGGAEPRAGHGLAGLTGRLAALNGTVTIHSPAGGPTMITTVLPLPATEPVCE